MSLQGAVLLKIGSELSLPVLVTLGIMSLIVGLIGGLVGIALGVIRMPIMTFLGVSPLIAASTNLAVSFVSSVAGSWPAVLQNRVVVRVVLITGLPAIGGAFVGGRYAEHFPLWLLLMLVSLLLVWSSLSMIFRARAEMTGRVSGILSTNSGRGEMTPKTATREGFLGLAIGVLGGVVGTPLGVIRLPALIQVLKMDPRLAIGTNLVITVLTGAFGFAGHIVAGRLDILLLMVVGIPGSVGMYVGSRFTDRFDATRLRLIVGVNLLLMAPFVFADAITRIGD
jgi:hypothetical protein